MGISHELEEIGRELLPAQLAHPTVRGIADGTLDERVFRSWLEQDHLYLLDYVRVFSRLAWQAPDAHLGDLVDLAHSTFHEELSLHRSLAAEFGADLDNAVKGAPCTAYTSFLLEAAADYADGLAALYPCMWGYSEIGRALAENPPSDPRYKRWVDSYADPAFAALARRCAVMLDEAAPDPARARALFTEAMHHELAFWSVP
ncbi:transcriptional regulator [Actinocorallia libanotica]|uniref:Thiaminase-2/PQQC domain-containing protein n=1 Tax=Actinocorallia libanotica TaxID=46162 RepID=A0ABN1RYN2_9ACTN